MGSWSQNCASPASSANRTYSFNPNGRLRITPVDVNTPTNYWWRISGNTLTLGNRDGSTVYEVDRQENSFRMIMDDGEARLYNCSIDANLYTAQPSFQCVGEMSWVQKTICNDQALASQDRELAELAERMLATEYGDEVQRINSHWREEWERCGGSGSISGCLGWVYRGWIEQLRARQPTSAPSPGQSDVASDDQPRSDTTLAQTAAELRRELRVVERRIKDALPRADRVDFGLMSANWHVNEIMIGCASRPECSALRYRERIAYLSAIRSPHFQHPTGNIVEGDPAGQ